MNLRELYSAIRQALHENPQLAEVKVTLGDTANETRSIDVQRVALSVDTKTGEGFFVLSSPIENLLPMPPFVDKVLRQLSPCMLAVGIEFERLRAMGVEISPDLVEVFNRTTVELFQTVFDENQRQQESIQESVNAIIQSVNESKCDPSLRAEVETLLRETKEAVSGATNDENASEDTLPVGGEEV
jgi:hypothetical protein